ncbi:28S ribosomal protein S6, mitochondrial [Tupaia chinensis]|uniref:28S ribosomal protein S6, mitochondrial n=1 Tax=Tupaia chinensis TaxID=246437 RepID=UPI0003C9082B|nr:28S ribosomal protein S6, mitochondrial [Tupaia chinensis]
MDGNETLKTAEESLTMLPGKQQPGSSSGSRNQIDTQQINRRKMYRYNFYTYIEIFTRRSITSLKDLTSYFRKSSSMPKVTQPPRDGAQSKPASGDPSTAPRAPLAGNTAGLAAPGLQTGVAVRIPADPIGTAPGPHSPPPAVRRDPAFGREGPSSLSVSSEGRVHGRDPREPSGPVAASFPPCPRHLRPSASRDLTWSGAAHRAFGHAPLRAGFDPESHAAAKSLLRLSLAPFHSSKLWHYLRLKKTLFFPLLLIDFEPETAAALKRTIEALMDRGAIVRSLENLGERALPYMISAHNQRHQRGGYFLVDFYAPTTTVQSMMEHLSRDIDVIRPNIVKHPLTQEVKECEGIVPVPLEEKLYSTKKKKK